MFSKAKRFLSTTTTRGQVNPLFSYTSGRWLVNNDAQLRGRYAPFNVEGLLHVASRAVGSPVYSMTKLPEFTNRAFLLKHDNGAEVIARIPTPMSGPPHIATASEVATMDFLRRLGLPVPRVFAWSADAETTEVESEFIIMEKVEGTHLVEREWETVDHVDLAQVGEHVSPHDIDGPQREYTIDEFLDDVPEGVDISPFCVGPIARKDFWQGERASMDEVYRGPWTSALQYTLDIAKREQHWIDRFSKPHMHDDFLCVTPLQGKEDDHIELLERYKTILPYLIPKEPRYLSGHLWHPELVGSHLFVLPSAESAPDGKTKVDITSIIGWRGASILPAFLHLITPKVSCDLYAPREALVLPPDFDTLDAWTQRVVLDLREEALHQEQFETIAFGDLKLDDTHLPVLEARRELDLRARQTWQTGLLPFKEPLIEVYRHFPSIAPGIQCPINFPPSELSAHIKALEFCSAHRDLAQALNAEFGMGEFGHVPEGYDHPEYFEHVQEMVEAMRQWWMDDAKTEEERRIREFMWPYRDTLEDDPRTHLAIDLDEAMAKRQPYIPFWQK